ncbi:MAG: ParB/RepB/Spo0J family partition protein [Syntrophus sp. (in: bacteria)]
MIALLSIKPGYSDLRLTSELQTRNMEESLRRLGQLQPVIVHPSAEGEYNVIDGIKRYYAAHLLGWDSIDCRVLSVEASMAKVMIWHYNKKNNSLSVYEEGLIVHRIKTDHGLEQKQIAKLMGQSASWVCRRLSLIEKLESSVQDELKMGAISASHVREIVKLPRGNQDQFIRTIISEGLTSRQSKELADKFIGAKNKQESKYILEHAREVLESSNKGEMVNDNRLSVNGNRILKATELLILQQHILTGCLTNHQITKIEERELLILNPGLRKIIVQADNIRMIINKINDERRAI